MKPAKTTHPAHTSWLLSSLVGLGSHLFFQGSNSSAKAEPRSTTSCWRILTRSAGQSSKIPQSEGWPQRTTLHIHRFPPLSCYSRQHHMLSYFQFMARFHLLDEPTLGCKHTHPNNGANAAASLHQLRGTWNNQGNYERHAAKVAPHSSAYQFPTRTCWEHGVGIPGDTMSVYSTACPLLLHAHTYWDLDSLLPKKQSREEWGKINIHAAYHQW